jgi:glucokinase
MDVLAIGIAAPGPLDPQKGIIYKAVNIPGWENLPLRDLIQDHFGVPVALENDANLAALGEVTFGAGRGHHHLLYLTISTGVGGGVIINDELLTGFRGLGSELGHVTVLPDGPVCSCGKRGHLEAVASGPAIARYVAQQIADGQSSQLANQEPLTAYHVAQAAADGDELATRAYQRAGTFLGQAIADFLHIFNPSIVVLGGGVIQSGELLLESLRRTLQESVLSPQYLEQFTLTTAELGDQSGLLGALTLARRLVPSQS